MGIAFGWDEDGDPVATSHEFSETMEEFLSNVVDQASMQEVLLRLKEASEGGRP